MGTTSDTFQKESSPFQKKIDKTLIEVLQVLQPP